MTLKAVLAYILYSHLLVGLFCLRLLARHLDDIQKEHSLCVSRKKNLVNNIPLKLTSSHSNFMIRMKYSSYDKFE